MAFAQQQKRRTQRPVIESDKLVAIVSDSDTDWHVISSSSTSSPILFPSESESSFRPSSDAETESDSQAPFLPSHDGTGTFVMQDVEFFSSDQISEGSSIHCAHTPASFEQQFVPTLAGVELQSADDEPDVIKFTTKREHNLDSIPVHHPGILGSSASTAILSIVWANLKRLTTHLIENDTNTADTLSNLMSEAVMEGCMPFSSHLHMDIEPYRVGG